MSWRNDDDWQVGPCRSTAAEEVDLRLDCDDDGEGAQR